MPSATSVAVRIMGGLRPDCEPRKALDAALAELQSVFAAQSAVFVARDESAARFYWTNAAPPDGDVDAGDAELDPADEPTYLFYAPPETWFAVERGPSGGHEFDVVALPPHQSRPRRTAIVFPERFRSAHPFRSLLALTNESTGQWVNRLLLFDARVGVRELRLLRSVSRQVFPAIRAVELLARLRSRVGAAERARIASDLHDGVIQSLIGLEMQVDVWRREPGADPATVAKLTHVQQALHAEVLDLRDLIQSMKPISVNPEHVLDHLAELVARFQRNSGINAHFVTETDELAIPASVCDQIVRIVQEALANVRKHSGARNVLVRVSAPAGYWKFEVDDDGRGFEFQGRYSHAELDLKRKGPVLIKERVRSIGAQLAVESDPGHGARIEVWLSRRTNG